MKNGISDSALKRLAQYQVDTHDEGTSSHDAPIEDDNDAQERADTLYRWAYEGLAESLAGPGYEDARGRVLEMMMEDPESFFRKAFDEIRLYEG